MSQVKQIKDATDIIAIIGERIELKKSGSQYRALCPFHSEKSPSFFVSEAMQRYKCFGCQESGDALEFLQKYEGLTFAESLEYLADKAGITLETFHHSEADEEKSQLLQVLDLAKEYYHFLLTKHPTGQPALAYLKNRGVTAESIKLFSLGLATDSWDGLIKYLVTKKKYSLQLLEKAGLVVRKNNNYYDRFRNRIIFPLRNHRGQVLGFSGRVMDPTIKTAKYINSPETSLYHKSQMLFALAENYQAIRKKELVVVTEGELDCISSVQAHLPYTVAIKGSALTEEQIKLLSRLVKKVVLALDQDEAGLEASKRAIHLATESQLDLKVANLAVFTPEELEKLKDPDDMARFDAGRWRQAIKTAVPVYEFLLQTAISKHDALSPEGQKAILQELAPEFSQMAHAIERDFYLKKLAALFNVRQELIEQDLKTIFNSQFSISKTFKAKDNTVIKKVLSRRQKIEHYLLFLFLQLKAELQTEK